MRSNANRHSIILSTDSQINVRVGSVLVFKLLAPLGSQANFVMDYDGFGDMLYKIDNFQTVAGTEESIIETYTEERPTETP